MAKKINNFQKFSKLASIVKNLADKNPEIMQQIIKESESISNNKWNKIQNWTSKNIFVEFKELPIKEFTLKNVENKFTSDVPTEKPSKCGNISNVTEAEILGVDLFELENLLRTFDPNLQVQIDVKGGDGFVNTNIVKIKDLNVKSGGVNKQLRDLIGSDSDKLQPIRGIKLRKKGKAQGDKSNCSYYIKFVFEEDADLVESELSDSVVEDGVQYADLSPKQKEMRNRRLKKADVEKSKRVQKAKKKQFITPKKVTSSKEDTEIQKKIADSKRFDPKAERIKEFRGAIKELRELLKDDLITKKQFKKSFDKLNNNLEKGGEI